MDRVREGQSERGTEWERDREREGQSEREVKFERERDTVRERTK